jgi:hypothetical protein
MSLESDFVIKLINKTEEVIEATGEGKDILEKGKSREAELYELIKSKGLPTDKDEIEVILKFHFKTLHRKLLEKISKLLSEMQCPKSGFNKSNKMERFWLKNLLTKLWMKLLSF